MSIKSEDSGLYSPILGLDTPIWSVIQIQNSVNSSLVNGSINYDEWHHLMSICADIIERLTNGKN